jgi:1-acyl-sn-glycerol-3-phosphate acyltransferase
VDSNDPIASSRVTPSHTLRALKGVNRLFARVYHHVEVQSPCLLPSRGPAILVCNHTSGLDPQLIQSACGRVITWMMAREYYEMPYLRSILDIVGVIPVARGARDLGATRAAMRALEQGQALGIFPEGRIEPTRELLPFQTGVALLAIKSEAPIYPAYLDGTQRGLNMWQAFARRQRATLRFGPPMRFPRSHGQMERVAQEIQHTVAVLQSQSCKP